MGGKIGSWSITNGAERDKALKEVLYKIAHSIPLQTQEYLDAKYKFEKETDELIEGFTNLGEKKYIRGQRASSLVLDDDGGVPQEIVDEVCKPFIKGEDNEDIEILSFPAQYLTKFFLGEINYDEAIDCTVKEVREQIDGLIKKQLKT